MIRHVNSYSEEREAISTQLLNFFDNSVIPVQFENHAKYHLKDSSLANLDNIDRYIRLTIIGEDSIQQEISSGRDRIFGEILINIYVREGLGSEPARQIADTLFPVFNRQLFNGIQCRSTSYETVPPDSGWYSITLATQFYWDRCED